MSSELESHLGPSLEVCLRPLISICYYVSVHLVSFRSPRVCFCVRSYTSGRPSLGLRDLVGSPRDLGMGHFRVLTPVCEPVHFQRVRVYLVLTRECVQPTSCPRLLGKGVGRSR